MTKSESAGAAKSPDPASPPENRGFVIQGRDGEVQHAANGIAGLTVIPDGPSRLRKRNAIKNAGTPQARTVQWIYGQLGDVRCYVKEEAGLVSVVLTKQDLYP